MELTPESPHFWHDNSQSMDFNCWDARDCVLSSDREEFDLTTVAQYFCVANFLVASKGWCSSDCWDLWGRGAAENEIGWTLAEHSVRLVPLSNQMFISESYNKPHINAKALHQELAGSALPFSYRKFTVTTLSLKGDDVKTICYILINGVWRFSSLTVL
jgi:hypothetical protein